MKLLLDQNLSHRLVNQLSGDFPDINHVRNLGMSSTSDTLIWDYAQENDLCIVTKDVDFSDRVSLLGFPPKIIWISRGNCSTRDIRLLLEENKELIQVFLEDQENGVLKLD